MDILVITNGGIGDQIHFSSLIKGLKNKYVHSRISVFCHPYHEFIYRYNEDVYEILHRLEQHRFHIGFNFALKNDLIDIFESVAIDKRNGFRKILGKLKPTNKFAEDLMKLVIYKKFSDKSLGEWFCQIAGVEWNKPIFNFKSMRFFDDCDIVLQYGTNKEEKNWPKKYYKEILKLLKDKRVYVTGHIKYEEDIKEICENSIPHLIGENYGLYDVARLLEKTTHLITPDTCVAHIGVALDKNVIVLSNCFDRGYAFSKKFNNVQIIKMNSMENITPNLILQYVL